MAENKKTDLLDYIVLLVKWKRFLFFFFLISMVVSYLAIYFFVNERFESTALLLPSNEQNSSSILSGLSGISGLKNLPIDIGGFNSGSDADLYNSIVYSRSLLNHVIEKFNLIKVYKVDTTDIAYHEDVLKILRKSIDADINEDGITYSITTTAPTPGLAANITNYIVAQLNKTIIDLKIKKSKLNREFLEARVNEIKDSLRNAENQMKVFQEKTGMFEAESQTKAILEQIAQFQASLAEKQTEYSIYKEIYGINSPQAANAKIVAKEFGEKLKNMEGGKDSINTLLSLNKLPQNAIDYFRRFRDVEVFTNILEFELPLYEQAKFQEQKDVPILQVIDNAIPPAKRSYPKRVLTAGLISIGMILIAFIFIYIKENDDLMSNDKVKYIQNNIFKWKSSK